MNKCNGTNCEAINGDGHSEECLKEYWDSVNGVGNTAKAEPSNESEDGMVNDAYDYADKLEKGKL